MTTPTGHQLKAARALAGVDQRGAAKAAGLTPATLSRLEAFGPTRINALVDTLEDVIAGFATLGVTFVNDDWPGVRLRRGPQ